MRNDHDYIMPFLWIHGEDEKTYRKMVNVIHDSNISAFCVESRPHRDFLRQKWWDDLTVILDEAEKLGMRVWLLDDKHFPTGYAAGALENAPLKLKRRHIFHKSYSVVPNHQFKISLSELVKVSEPIKVKVFNTAIGMYNKNPILSKVNKNELITCAAYGDDGEIIDLMPFVGKNFLEWNVPAKQYTVEVCVLTYDSGSHRNYINMLDSESCKVLIDTVYESHYRHFKDKFGTVIAGFFSDEPEIGNGCYAVWNNTLGTEQTLPYSRELHENMKHLAGESWALKLPLLWKNDYDAIQTANYRYQYMDTVTKLVENCFSKQIGQWCRAHKVQYIGHIIEDGNQHARTGTSLGHYFRGLKWQSMAGIDNIGGQVMPGGENATHKNIFQITEDGEFYHYALGKLGVSLAEINPNMNGNSMCEIFGNYGWTEGTQLQKYLVDHFLVRGINHFVPHAFTCKNYPDRDCPPHFYAHGHNPLYRYFGVLMKYTDRICRLLSGGHLYADTAVLYHAESEWCGKAMYCQKPARVLYDNQIDFRFIPCDALTDRAFYKTKISNTLSVNGKDHLRLIIPYSEFLPDGALSAISEFVNMGGQVYFIDGLPKSISLGENIPSNLKRDMVISLDKLQTLTADFNQSVHLAPGSHRIRCCHYQGEKEVWFLTNEGDKPYSGSVQLGGSHTRDTLYFYDAFRHICYPLDSSDQAISIFLAPNESALFSASPIGEISKNSYEQLCQSRTAKYNTREITSFVRSICKSIDYPNFTDKTYIDSLEGYEQTDKKFSGYLRYETFFENEHYSEAVLEITDPCEGTEVFLNGKSLGVQIVAPYRYDLTNFLICGTNHIAIETATTLARERGKKIGKSGLTGKVFLKTL